MLQVGLRSENIMITHPDSAAAYRPTLAHSPTLPETWPTTRPTPREPATSARGAPSVFRHPSTGSHTPPAAPPADPLGTPPTRAKRASSDTPPIRLRSLSHIVELAQDDASNPPPTPARRNRSGYTDQRRYEISSMPVGDVIEMVAGLLTKITTTNDRQHEALSRSMPPPSAVGDAPGATTTTNSVLAFHGKNVPSITIMSYLSRIHKYCPTTYEVFLSLLVYFDRMTESVNKRSNGPQAGSGSVSREERVAPIKEVMMEEGERHVFVVDSFNIHRLVIAGVTCASKFFSDVFYTNSRYAKVGGLPLQELNHLELQFLILNDFRLSVPVEELEAYGTMLVQFYAREAIANTNLRTQSSLPPPSPSQPDPDASAPTST